MFPDIALLIGREGDLPVGVDLPDTGISRQALVIILRQDGWLIECRNTNRAVLQPWGQDSVWLTTGAPLLLRWPRIGIRLIGSSQTAQHWVLLEADSFTIPAAAELRGPQSTFTESPNAPAALTVAQREALATVFAQHLAWPPIAGPSPVTLQSAARRLRVSQGAVAQRLEGAQQRAYSLGSHRQFGVTEPDYLYALVSHGYVTELPPAVPAVLAR